MEQCTRCKERPRRRGQRWCKECHAAYMRANRPRHSELSDEARKKANTRSYTNTLVKRRHLVREPCESCGALEVEAHHEDYSDPRTVRWLCRGCHLQEH